MKSRLPADAEPIFREFPISQHPTAKLVKPFMRFQIGYEWRRPALWPDGKLIGIHVPTFYFVSHGENLKAACIMAGVAVPEGKESNALP